MPSVSKQATVFRTARGWRIFMYLFGSAMVLLGVAMPFLAADGAADKSVSSLAFFAVMGFSMVAFFGYTLLETRRWTLRITTDSITTAGILQTKTLPHTAIRGFTLDQNYTYIHASDPALPKLKISYAVEHYKDIQHWLAAHYPNLDAQELAAHQRTVLTDYRLGWTEDQREARIQRARSTANWLNGIGFVAAGWVLLWPVPYQVSITVNLLLPVLGIAAMWLHPEVLRIDEASNEAYPQLGALFLMPSLSLSLRALLDFDLLDAEPAWLTVLPAIAGVLIVLALANQNFMTTTRKSALSWVFLVMMAVPYGFGATILLNCAYDTTSLRLYSARVQRKYISQGKIDTYHVRLGAWAGRSAGEEATISRARYQQLHPGDSVRVGVYPGTLGVPWFRVEP
jgi:hypothetical protein